MLATNFNFSNQPRYDYEEEYIDNIIELVKINKEDYKTNSEHKQLIVDMSEGIDNSIQAQELKVQLEANLNAIIKVIKHTKDEQNTEEHFHFHILTNDKINNSTIYKVANDFIKAIKGADMTKITLFDNSRKDKYLLTNDLLEEVKEQNEEKFSFIKTEKIANKTMNSLDYKSKSGNNDTGMGGNDRPNRIIRGFVSPKLISRFGIGLLIDGYIEIDEDKINNAIKNFLINLANDKTYLTKLQDVKIKQEEIIANLEANENEEHSNNRIQINKLKIVLKKLEDRIIEEDKIVNQASPFNLNNDWDKYLNISITRKEDGSELTINFNNLIKLDNGYIASIAKSALEPKLGKLLEDSIYNDFSINGKNDRLLTYENAIADFNKDELTVAEDGLTITESRVDKIDDEPISFPDMYKIKQESELKEIKQPITINKEIKDKYISFINEYKFLLLSGEVEYEASCNQYDEKLSELNKLFTDMNNLGYDTTKIEEDIEEINDKLSIIHTIQKEIEELNAIQKEILDKDNTIDSYRANLNNHIKKLVEDNKVKSDEVKEGKENYKLLDEAYTEIEEDNKDKATEIFNLDFDIGNLKNDKSLLEDKVEEKEGRIKDYIEESITLNKDIEDLEKVNEDLEKDIIEKDEKIANQTISYNKQLTIISNKNDKIDEQDKWINDIKPKYKEAVDTITNQKIIISNKNNTIDEKDKYIEEIRPKYNKAVDTINDIKPKYEKAIIAINNHTKELDNDENRKTIKSRNSEITKLKAEIAKLKKDKQP